MGPTETGWGFPNPATPPGSSVYYSIRLAPPERRDDLAALWGFRREVREIPGRVSDPGVAAAKLGWWREELERIFEDRARHPLGQRLAPLVERLGLPRGPFLELVLAVEAELERREPRDVRELAASAERDLGALFELLVRADGDPDPDRARIGRARRLGAYATLVCGIRDSGLSLRRGRSGFVSDDLLAGLGLARADLTLPAGRTPLPRALAALAGQARTLRGAGEATAGLPVAVRIEVCLLDRLLAEIARDGFEVADRRVELTPVRKLFYAWRESRRRNP